MYTCIVCTALGGSQYTRNLTSNLRRGITTNTLTNSLLPRQTTHHTPHRKTYIQLPRTPLELHTPHVLRLSGKEFRSTHRRRRRRRQRRLCNNRMRIAATAYIAAVVWLYRADVCLYVYMSVAYSHRTDQTAFPAHRTDYPHTFALVRHLSSHRPSSSASGSSSERLRNRLACCVRYNVRGGRILNTDQHLLTKPKIFNERSLG